MEMIDSETLRETFKAVERFERADTTMRRQGFKPLNATVDEWNAARRLAEQATRALKKRLA